MGVLGPEKRGLRLRESRAGGYFSRDQLPGREDVHEAHGQTHKARGVWMSCASPEAAASAQLAQAMEGSEPGAPCHERQHFLVRGATSRSQRPPAGRSGE